MYIENFRVSDDTHGKRKVNINTNSKDCAARRSDLAKQGQYYRLETDLNEKAIRYYRHKPYQCDLK